MVSIRTGRRDVRHGIAASVGKIASIGRVAGLVAALAGCSSISNVFQGGGESQAASGAGDTLMGDSTNVHYAAQVQREAPADAEETLHTADDNATPLRVNRSPAAILAAATPPVATPEQEALPPPPAAPVAAAPAAPAKPAPAPAAPAPAPTPVAAAPVPAKPAAAAPAPAPVVAAAAPAKPAPAPAPAPTPVAVVSAPPKPGPAKPAPGEPQIIATLSSPNLQLRREALARADTGPSAPPAKAPDMIPPPRPDISEPVPVPGTKPAHPPAKRVRRRLLDVEYQRRLAQSASTMAHPPLATPDPAPAPSAPAALPPVHLRPPRGGAGKGLASPPPGSSFQVAALDFAEANARLTPQDRKAVAGIVRLYRRSGGTIRILGHTPGGFRPGGHDIGLARADAVAAELVRHGVPAGRILVAGAPMPLVGAPGAEVFIDY